MKSKRLGLMAFVVACVFVSECCGAQERATEADVFSRVCAQALSPGECKATYLEWISRQKPSVSREELFQWYKGVRDSIVSSSYEYEMSVDSQKMVGWKHIHRGACLGEKLYYGEELLAGNIVQRSISKVFNGHNIQSYDRLAARGAIKAFQGRDEFIPLDDLLALVMLRDMDRDTGPGFLFTDLAACLDSFAFVQEEADMVNDTACIVVYIGIPPTMKVYLDPKRDYAFVRRDSFINEYVSPGGALSKRYLNARTTALDNQSVGNHIWLPREVRHTLFFSNGAERNEMNFKVLSCSINDVSSQRFENLIPRGVPVHDSIRNVTYRDVESPQELEEVLDASLFTLQAR